MARVVVIGSGGREHALGWKLAASQHVSQIAVAPGGAAMPEEWERWPLGGPSDYAAFAARCRQAQVDLVVVGPDNPLADALVDACEAAGVRAFGPTRAAAQLEASKAFAKEVMAAAGVPTARHFVAENSEEARKILRSVPWTGGRGWVVKADGLALGKGVCVCATLQEANEFAAHLGGVRLVIEERLQGEEVSWLAFCDGERCATLEPARDHKRLRDGDQGPNTGGMGAFSPVPGVPDEWHERMREKVFLPVLREMKKRGAPFRGLLYAGLMVDPAADRFWVLEFNARFGDPETQALLPRMNADLYEWCLASARGDLSKLPARVPFRREHAVFVVAAAGGYPDAPAKGRAIEGLDGARAPDYFFAGVGREGSQWVTSGGRVLGALGLGSSLAQARAQAYGRLSRVSFEGMQFRRDIGGIE